MSEPFPPPESDEEFAERNARERADAVAAEVAAHGEARPPWVAFPEPQYHPLSMGWRMGGGESHLWMWRAWAYRHFDRWPEADRIAYFERWGVQPRWLAWVGETVWVELDRCGRRAAVPVTTAALEDLGPPAPRETRML